MNTRKYSSKQEKNVAKTIGGKQVPNSGATLWKKGDVVFDDWLVECKTVLTEKQSIPIKREWLEKIKEEAFAMNKQYSALAFNFEPGGENYYIVDGKIFENMIRKLKYE